MNANALRKGFRDRELSLILNESGAELIDNGSGAQVWASDSDDNFREDFPDFIDTGSPEEVADVLDYLVDQGLITEDEADETDILVAEDGPGDEDGNGDDDEDGPGDEDDDEDEDE
jgi:hypothetical protein